MRALMQYQPDAGPAKWLDFTQPFEVIEATEPAEVRPALAAIETAVNHGACAAGFITYEAAAGLDRVFKTHASAALPLLRFGLYPAVQPVADWITPAVTYHVGDWQPSVQPDTYAQAIHAIKERIANGDTYQVNYTLRLRAPFTGDPLAWFRDLYEAQHPHYAAYIDDGEHALCSVSPELFFRLDRHTLLTRPMKGTARRGRTWEEDEEQAERLHNSAKNRAENLMIVDMMRNDLGRIARVGSVRAYRLFDVERYPTVLQMTSTVTADTHAGFAEIMSALFPSCSITGAPKVRTMDIIRELEPEPRGVYTGTMGFLLPHHPLTGVPGRFAQFNVAIRTAHVQRRESIAEYGTGGGIVWDSEPDTEYRECLTKALVLRPAPRAFDLLETMCWKPATGIFLLEEHMERLEKAARYFGRPFDRHRLLDTLRAATERLDRQRRYRVRLTYDAAGHPHIETAPVTRSKHVWRVRFDDRPVDTANPWLYHKTTHRTVYDEAKKRHPDVDDVLLWNDKGDVTESCVANVVARFDGAWHTPPVSCGLLGGTLRNALVKRERLRERPMTKNELRQADCIGLINSVRGYIGIKLV